MDKQTIQDHIDDLVEEIAMRQDIIRNEQEKEAQAKANLVKLHNNLLKKDFKIGDKVVFEGETSTECGIITAIEYQKDTGEKYYMIGGSYFHEDDLRLPTPKELEKYFK